MATESLAAALEREHHEIDEAVLDIASGRTLEAGRNQTEPTTSVIDALRRHIYLEEEFLFPPLRAAGLVAPLFVMVREHGRLWRTLESLQLTLSGSTVSPSALHLCHELAVQLQHHNSKEERILYPQADRVLPPSANAQLRAFLDCGQMPEGWVCHGARS
jgi:iron-sulfur cluster repair protein YtfE (RIC family)